MRNRIVDAYDAWKDAADRWPNWRILRARIGRREKIIVPDEHLILMNEAIDPQFGAAQALAHLDLEHHTFEAGVLPTEKQSEAEWLARMRMDTEGSRPAMAEPEGS